MKEKKISKDKVVEIVKKVCGKVELLEDAMGTELVLSKEGEEILDEIDKL